MIRFWEEEFPYLHLQHYPFFFFYLSPFSPNLCHQCPFKMRQEGALGEQSADSSAFMSSWRVPPLTLSLSLSLTFPSLWAPHPAPLPLPTQNAAPPPPHVGSFLLFWAGAHGGPRLVPVPAHPQWILCLTPSASPSTLSLSLC